MTDEEIRQLYSSSDIIRMDKLRNISWVGIYRAFRNVLRDYKYL